MNVVDAVSSTTAVKAAFSQVGLYNGSTLLGTAQSPVADASGTGYIYVFNSFTSPLVVPQGSSVSLTLEGTAGSVVNGSLTDNTQQTFEMATTSDSINNTSALAVVARGNTSNKTAAVTFSNATGNPQTTLRTTLGLTATPVTGAPPASFQQIGSITLTANAAGDAVVNNLKLTFSTSSPAFLATVVLHDQSGNNVTSSDKWATSTVSGATVIWTFDTSSTLSGETPLVITAGGTYTLTVWGDLSQIPSQASQSIGLTASIAGSTDFGYLDADLGASPAASLVNLTANQVPVTVTNLESGVGGQL